MAERKYQFERLTPIDNMDLDVYEEAIDYGFDNSDINNAAVFLETGSFFLFGNFYCFFSCHMLNRQFHHA